MIPIVFYFYRLNLCCKKQNSRFKPFFLSQGKPILARIKPKPMNRLPSGPAVSGAGSSTPTGTVTPIATTPGMIVSPGSIPMVATATPVPAVPIVVNQPSAVNKNGYQRQQQQQQQQQPPPQQPSVLPYAMMGMPGQPIPGQPQQQVTMVPATGTAQGLPVGSGQPPNMVSMTATTLAQAPYHFVSSNSSAPNVHVSAPNYNGAPNIIYVSCKIILWW